jgi:HlyD family secretion protein
MKNILLPLCIIGGLTSGCQPTTEKADAYGTFEAREVLVSAEASGPLLFLDVDEGITLDSGQLVGLVDTMPLHLQRQQIEARIQSIRQKVQHEQPQIDVLLSQKANLEREVRRLEGLLQEQAVPEQQVDDLRGQIDVVQNRILATRDQIQTANRSVLSEIEPLEAQYRTLTDKLDRCRIYNPITGRVLMQLVEPEEMAQMGRPLYKIADLSELTLRAYVTGAQLPHLNLGQTVEVWIDHSSGDLQPLSGTVTWIAHEAEFTPKIVQTRDERVNLVYAVKVRVHNDGRLKIGMPGELNFLPKQKPES